MTALSSTCLASFHARQAETIGLGFFLSGGWGGETDDLVGDLVGEHSSDEVGQ